MVGDSINIFLNSIKIIIYFLFAFSMYFVVEISNKNHKNVVQNKLISSKNISISSIFFLSLLYGLYSIIVSSYSSISDRWNFAFRFSNNFEYPWTVGLNLLAKILHLFTEDPRILFFGVSFVTLFVVLVAYNKFSYKYPLAVLLMGVSLFNTYSFYLLKQAPSIAFGSLALAYLFNKNRIKALISLVVSILFHEAAFILIPLFLVLEGAKKRGFRVIEYAFLIIIILFFSSISSIGIRYIYRFSPYLTEQVLGYTNSKGDLQITSNLQSWVKFSPYYFITFLAFFKRSSLHNKIKNFDKFLVLSVFTSALSILSIYMYWMFRFAIYGYFPMFIYFSQIVQFERKSFDKVFMLCIMFLLLVLLTSRFLYQIFIIAGGF